MLTIKSPEFEHQGEIPSKYTCDGEDASPTLVIDNVPAAAQSLALIMDDPDAPSGTWVHWVVWNIPVSTTKIEENSVPAGAKQGLTSANEEKYGGPCPPSGTHRYFFKLYALDNQLNLPAGTNKKALEQAMQGHILEQAELMGTYRRKYL